MNPLIYKIIHLAGIMGLFTAIGGLLYQAKDSKCKANAIIHGISMVLILVAGFGMVAKSFGNDFAQGWLIAKIIIWFLLAASLPLAKRKVIAPSILLLITIALGALSAYLALFKPF